MLEVVVDEPGTSRQSGHRGVRAHGADRLLGVPGHRSDEQLQFLERVAEGLLSTDHPAGRFRRSITCREVAQMNQVVVEPLSVWPGGCQIRLDLVVPDDPSLECVDEKHSAGLKAALLDDLR